MKKAALLGVLGFAVAVSTASAGVTTFYNIDIGASAGSPHPNSSAAAAAFTTAAGVPLDTLNFENFTVGMTVPLTWGGGTITAANGSGPITADIANFQDSHLGFNTTPGGSNFLSINQNMLTGDTTVTFSMDSPIWAFGAYITGLGTSNGALTANFNDGQAQSFSITGAASGGVLFWGFIDTTGRTSSVTFDMGPTGGFVDDGYGIDDVIYSNPEPGTGLLLAGSAILLVMMKRYTNKTNAQ